jgi:hypothetical protein
MQPEGSYVDALNWIRNDSGRLTNEELEEITQTLTGGNYKLLGHCPVQDSFVCFFKQEVGSNSYSEIGIFDNTTKQYRQIFNDSFTNPYYELLFNNEIDSVARINSSNEIVVYFVEKDQKPRRFNITQFENLGNNRYSSELYNAVEDWNLQLGFKMPYGEYSLQGGGNLPSGTYSFVYRYVTDENNKTTFSIPSRFINIPGEINVDSATNTPLYNDETLGGAPQTNSNLSLKIKLKNIDNNYNLIEVVVITYIGLTNTLSIRSLGTYENVLDKEIIFSDDTQYVGDQIAESALLESPVFINSATSIEQKDNILVLSNITSKKYDVGFQQVANNIDLNWSVDKIPVDNRRNLNGAYLQDIRTNTVSTPGIQKILTDRVIICKSVEQKSGTLNITPNSDKPEIFLNNQDVTFPAEFTGFGNINFADGSCDISVLVKGEEATLNTGSYDEGVFRILSQTSSSGVTVAQGTGSGYKYTVPAPTAMTEETGWTKLSVQVSWRQRPDDFLSSKTFNVQINYKLSRPIEAGGTPPTMKIDKISNISPYRPYFFREYFIGISNFTTTTPSSIKLTTSSNSGTGLTGGGPVQVAYQWKKNGADIPGANNSTYTVSSTDFSSNTLSVAYTCQVTYQYSGTVGGVVSVPTINFPTGRTTQNDYASIQAEGYTYQNIDGFEYDNHNVVELNRQQSNIYTNPFILKGFQRGEVYSFSITPIYKDGSVGFSYHIPGKPFDPSKPNRLKEWRSTEPYSSSYISAGLTGNIKHHEMPDYDVAGYVGDAHYINVLRVTAANVNFTTEQLQNIQGYVIGYQPRVDDLTRRVVDTGFVKPYLKKSSSGNWKYQGSLLDGNVEFNGDGLGPPSANVNWNPGFNEPYAMFYSADSTINKASALKNDYNIQQLGVISNLIVRPDPQYQKDTSAFFNSQNPQWTQYRFIYHNASFSSPSLYTPTGEYILSKFPYLLWKNRTDAGPVFLHFFMELNNWTSRILNKTRIKYFSYIDNITGPIDNGATDVAITNFPSAILRTNSAYTHIETDNSFLEGIIKTLIIAAVGNGNGFNRAFWQLAKNVNRFVPETNNTVTLDSTDAGDPKFRLVRITNDTDVQYGKLENATYTPCVVEYDDNGGLSNSVILEGDTYISKIFQPLVTSNSSYDDPSSAMSFLSNSLLGYYAESKNNYALRHKETNLGDFFPKTKEITSSQQVDALLHIPFESVVVSYNKQYSALASTRLTFPKPLFFVENTNYSNRSIYSKQAFESELIDQYRIFPANNFHDVPKHRGVITDTFVFNNNFYHHTEYGLWLSYFNPNTTQATSQGQVVLGNAGVFQLPSKLILDIKGGYMGTLDKSGTNTPFGRVFLDHKQGKIFLLTGEAPVEISDLGLFSFFRGFVNTDDKYSMGYDWANKRLLINNITQQKAISYYPKTQTWTSFHTFSPQAYFTTNGYSYAFGESFSRGTGIVGTFYNMDNSQGIRKGAHITYVENTAPDSFKRFDRIEMNTMSGGNQGINSPGFVEPNSYVFNDKSFTSIHAWTDRQNTTELPFSYNNDFDTNFLANYEINKVPVNYYRSSFHAELPLDAVIDPYQNIFDLSNTDINADFRAHMKGKFLYTKLSYNDDKPLVLNYIKTFFKPSVA